MTQCAMRGAGKVAVWVSLVLLCSAQASLGSIIVYRDEASFLAAAGNVTMESFEGLGAFEADVVVVDGFTLTNLKPGIDKLRVNDRQEDVHPTDGVMVASWDVHEPKGGLQFAFGLPTDVLGFTLIDPVDQGDPGEPDIMMILSDLGESAVVVEGLLPSYGEVFFGLISDEPFSLAELNHTGLRLDGIGIDAVYFRPIDPGFTQEPEPDLPEPATVSLAAIGVLALGGYVKKRRKKQA